MPDLAPYRLTRATTTALLLGAALVLPAGPASAGDAPAAPSPVVRGYVTGIGGKALPGARVWFFDEVRGRDVVVRADTRGRYRIVVPRPRRERRLNVKGGAGYKTTPRVLDARRRGGPVRLDVRVKSVRTSQVTVDSSPRRTTVRVETGTRVPGAKRTGGVRVEYRGEDGLRRVARGRIGASGVRTLELDGIRSGRRRLTVVIAGNADTLAFRGAVSATVR